jgi:hypothetical protein
MKTTGRGLRRKKAPPEPLELLFMLFDCCMDRFSPNAWKVVCYVAAQHLRVFVEELAQLRNPGLFRLRRDFEQVGIMIPSPSEEAERSYRLVPGAPAPPDQPPRFVVINLAEFCHGVRLKYRNRDFGTGLSKSAVAEAIKEAIRSGVLLQKRRKSDAGRDLASLYAINWDRVQEFERLRRKGRKKF